MRKELLKNDIGISPVLGFVLMLALGVTILTTFQLSYVPVWNAEEELSHLKIMQDDFKVLKSNIESGILGGTTLSSPLIMGFKYSPKILVYNPREEAYASLEVRNNTWVEIRYNEVFPEGMTDDTSIKNVSTGKMIYSLQGARNYNSLIYENGMIRRGESNYSTSSQTVLANNTVFLPSVKALEYGTLTGVEKKSINIYPTSQQKNSVIGKNVWITLHTDPGYVKWWADSLEKEGADIKKTDTANGIVIANVSSSLVIKMGEAYISSSQKAAPPHSPARRLVKVSSPNSILPVDGVTDIIVEVQDEYNNPVPNVLVSFNQNQTKVPGNSYPNGELLQTSSVSGADGRAGISLKTEGAGYYYIDAFIQGYTTTFAYSASSQGFVMELFPALYSIDYYNVTATLKDSLGNFVPDGTNVVFEASDGSIIPGTVPTVSGKANTTLDISNANVTGITNIQVKETTTNITNITWDTINNIKVTSKSGYVFNSKDIRTTISTYGCVMYGISPGIYSMKECDTDLVSSHFVSLTNLTPSTPYYFIVNSSRPGKESVNSTEYMFVTEGTGDYTPPASVTNLINVTYEPLYIRWTWTDPADPDFDHVEVKIDEVSAGTVPKGNQSFNATYLMPNSAHNISIRTVDTSNNANGTWVTHNAATTSLFTYVVAYEISGSQGTVTDFPSAQSIADGGAAATFDEVLSTGTVERNNYTYVTGSSAANGTVTNFVNMQSNATGAFANLTEGGTVGSSTVAGYYATSSPTLHNNVIGAPNNVLDSINKNRITGSGFAAGGSGTITKVELKYYYSITSYGAGDIPTVGYTLNSVDTTAKTDTGNLAYNYPYPTYTIDITSVRGTWTWADVQSLALWLNVAKSGAASTTANVDAFEVNVTSSGTEYILNITTDTASVPDDTSYYLEMNYSRDAADTYGVYIWNGTEWNNRSSLNYPAGTWSLLNITLSPAEYNGGNPRIRYIDEDPAGALRGNLSIDYQRIHGYTPGIPGGYHLDVTTNTSGIPYAANMKLQLMYNATGDNFTLQLFNGSGFSWDDKEILNMSSTTPVEVPLAMDYLLPDGNFGIYTVNNLPRYYVLVRYVDNRDAGPAGKMNLHYQRVYSS